MDFEFDSERASCWGERSPSGRVDFHASACAVCSGWHPLEELFLQCEVPFPGSTYFALRVRGDPGVTPACAPSESDDSIASSLEVEPFVEGPMDADNMAPPDVEGPIDADNIAAPYQGDRWRTEHGEGRG